MKSIRLLIITFKNRISNEEIPLFRGAIINNFGNRISELFHNHQNEKLRYAYPLIQYKRINGNAAIFNKLCIKTKIEMLNKILIGNILSFTKGINIHIHSPLTCKLTKLEDSIPVSYKGVELKSFNAEFQANIILPDFIGLGKSSSINNGTINHIK